MPSPVATAPPRPGHVTPVDVAVLAETVGARLVRHDGATTGAARAVTGATLRAQHVRRGDLFAALPGSRAHGADFLTEAVQAGAAAVLTDPAGVERARADDAVRSGAVALLVHDDPRSVLGRAASAVYGDPSHELNVVGITGTSGKTTTTYLVESVLRAAGHTTGLVGTVETRVAGERLDSALTTPEAPDLQALLAVMVERGVTHVPMEVSSHALALGRVDGTRFAVGAFTNLSQDHLDFHRDMEDYFAAKALLFDGRAAREVVSADTDWGRRLVGPRTTTVSACTAGAEADPAAAATWSVSDVTAYTTGEQTFTAHHRDGRALPVHLRLPGRFNIANAVLAVAVVEALDVPPEALARGLAEVDVPGRMERVAAGQDFTAVVDYSHKPGAVAAVLEAARAQVAGRVLVVLGSGGDRDTAKRPLMGEAAARRADVLVVTDDNPRGEDPAAIRDAVIDGAHTVPRAERGEVWEIGDRRAAIAAAVRRAEAGDIVVVAGKGHETGQEVAGVVHPFADRDELAAALRGRGGAAAPHPTGDGPELHTRVQGDEEAR
ncbi:UDP-N-acetylmuramoyl-L-alanyl-D-glutamate--2,6-diaminopimelate ligase [Bounagaea algeriensis]